jgi:hypothetical protein
MLRTMMVCALLALSLTTPARAEETVEQYCKRVIADADKGKDGAFAAGLLYFHGKHMGKPCVKVDYVRAFDLLLQAGAVRDAQSVLNTLAERANSGSPKAQSAIREFEKRGWIEAVKE